MLISKFEEIKMLDDETFGEFYTRINNLRNSMVSLGKVYDVKLIKRILWSLPKRFKIKVTIIKERKDLDSMKIEELVGSLQTYKYSLPPVRKAKAISLKAAKNKSRVSSDEDSDNEEEYAIAMLAKNIGRLMKNDKFKKKFTKRLKEIPREAESEEDEKKDPRGPRCFECSSFGHVRADCRNLKQAKGKAYNATLSESEKEETSDKDQKFLASVAPHEEFKGSQSYYSDSSDEDKQELKEAYKILYVKFLKLRETHQQHVHELNCLKKERSMMLMKITNLEENLLETHTTAVGESY